VPDYLTFYSQALAGEKDRAGTAGEQDWADATAATMAACGKAPAP
jgi:hypothetical protein